MDAYYDVLIVGSGTSGLYSALQVKKLCSDLTCLVIERNQLFGGKAYEHRFENLKSGRITGFTTLLPPGYKMI